jgi:hypothetical protein
VFAEQPDEDVHAAEPSRHVIVCGLDGIGLTIVDQRWRVGVQVVVLEQFATAQQLASVSV